MGLKGRYRFARKPISVIGKVIVNTWDSEVVSDSLGNLYQL